MHTLHGIILVVLTYEIATVEHTDLCAIVRRHLQRLHTTFTARNINALSQQHQDFREVVPRLGRLWFEDYILKLVEIP